MSYLLNDPLRFAAESARGFVLANRGLVRRVDGGVVRTAPTPDGQVAVVIGGGSGHYPAFAGLVGTGLAHGAAMGNVFASPSAQDVYTVAKAVAGTAGVLLTYGNYAGDVLNFDQAEARLNAEGIPCRSVPVTDDIASAADAERDKRRGIAGDLAVFRAAAWAAEQGRPLDEVTAFARRANDRTRTLGTAFTGTTLPGADAPLFAVPAGRMAVGMGIHGEPGIDEQPLPSADGLARLLVERLLEDRPGEVGSTRGARVAVIVNGLGAVKGEELFVLFGSVADLLTAAGVEIVDPEVGEFATSFEMAGVSLTLFWLDEELEAAWRSPVYSPAYRKGSVDLAAATVDGDADVEIPVATEEPVPAASETSRAVATHGVAAIAAIRATIDRDLDELGRLDAVAGDGDHGIGMQRGATAAEDAARNTAARGAGLGTVLARAGDAWARRAGGTSGALWGAALRAVGTSLGDDDRPDGAAVARAVRAGADAITASGKAVVGDKTMVDAIEPFVTTLQDRVGAGTPLPEAWSVAARAATAAAAATADLLPRRGRARPHMQKSLGTPDPGAVSFAASMSAVGGALDEIGEQA